MCPTGTYLWLVHIVQRGVWGAFTYHGVTSDGCQAHDGICRGDWGNFFTCWITAPVGLICTDNHSATYGPYEAYNYGYFISNHQVLWGERCFIQS